MNATAVDDKRRTTLPQSVFDAAGLKPNDQIEWRVEQGEIRGRKVGAERGSTEVFPPGSLVEYLTLERDEEQLAILSACLTGPVAPE
jgi:bifunctional DNA-binding transcriptional regulator/antitoxin component of YhaV-PrlF toxin-antitoxin module